MIHVFHWFLVHHEDLALTMAAGAVILVVVALLMLRRNVKVEEEYARHREDHHAP